MFMLMMCLIFGPGVGFESARRWYLKGYRSLDMVVKKEPLSTAQKIGIELYRDFLEK